jgi:tripartite-type tricarboxylate transporter receptor subunit TctC
MPFDSLADFTPITEIVKVPLILVVNDAVPARNVAELIALARAQPGCSPTPPPRSAARRIWRASCSS